MCGQSLCHSLLSSCFLLVVEHELEAFYFANLVIGECIATLI